MCLYLSTTTIHPVALISEDNNTDNNIIMTKYSFNSIKYFFIGKVTIADLNKCVQLHYRMLNHLLNVSVFL